MHNGALKIFYIFNRKFLSLLLFFCLHFVYLKYWFKLIPNTINNIILPILPKRLHFFKKNYGLLNFF